MSLPRSSVLPRTRLRRKYRNTLSGGFDSKAEQKYAAQLELRKHGVGPGAIKDYRCQVPIKLEIDGNLVCRYVADFIVTFPDGREEIHEVKGFKTRDGLLKLKLLRILYPHWTLVVVDAARIR